MEKAKHTYAELVAGYADVFPSLKQEHWDTLPQAFRDYATYTLEITPCRLFTVIILFFPYLVLGPTLGLLGFGSMGPTAGKLGRESCCRPSTDKKEGLRLQLINRPTELRCTFALRRVLLWGVLLRSMLSTRAFKHLPSWLLLVLKR